jgi:uncharacterized HAD superfamily protein
MKQADEDRVVVVDIDGTICTVERDYTKCRLLPGCGAALRALRRRGYVIYLHTGRHINHLRTTVEWLRKHRVPYDHIVFGKPPARYYIDDRAVRFTGWNNVLRQLV